MSEESLFFIFILICIVSLRLYGHRKKVHHHYTRLCKPPEIEESDIVIIGKEMKLPSQEIHEILIKRFPYYCVLEPSLQKRFLSRLRNFMMNKIFIIKDEKGFKEMPVLVSASAIQIGFGLQQYKLPFYKYIRIYPEEYFSEKEFFRVLAGNVQENIISIAWNHLLKDYKNATDGVNTPLHEMSHALYIQKMVIDQHYARKFDVQYRQLLDTFRVAHQQEMQKQKDHYSEYAETDLQEFWAESVELFFEKPDYLVEHYPDVFHAMTLLLNQDPRNSNNPIINHNTDIKRRFDKLVQLVAKTSGAKKIINL